MRPVNNETIWARGRAISRTGYEAYLRSPQWFARRRRWVEEWASHAAVKWDGAAPQCRVCGRLWTLRTGELHHVTYHRLGAERFEDLVPLCQAHHEALHQRYETSEQWRNTDRRHATFGIIGELQRRHRETAS